MTESQHRVIVVEDDEHTRRQLVNGVNAHPALTVVAEARNFAAGRAALASTRCDVLLTDLGLPDGSGIDLIRQAAALPATESMVITVFGDERHVLAAIEAGAAGYLLKDAPPATIADAILTLRNGGSPISPVIARHVLKRFRSNSAALTPGARSTKSDGPATPVAADDGNEVPHLTPRETEVLKLVSRGCTNQEIADLLGMSFHTVTSHVKQIYRKLAVRSRSEAVFEASQLGILRLTDDD